MNTRRQFLKSTAAFTAGAMVFPMVSCKQEKTIGLQLYSVRDKIKQDLAKSLERVAEIGYSSVEAAGYSINDGTFYGKSPDEFVKLVESLGMKLNSSHTVFELDSAEKVIADAASAGVKYIIYPYLPDQYRKDLDGYKATAEKFNKMGEIAQKNGIKFGYHNHAFEFEKMDDVVPMELLIEQTDPSLVTFELDLYWVTRGGYDPVDYFKKFSGRFEILHVKDMVKAEDQFFSPVGNGRIDFARIFAEKETAGMKYFFVEQDRFREFDPFQSVEMSFNYLNSAEFI